MSGKVLVPLAEGFEEIEAVTIIDVLRRAEVEVVVAGVAPGRVRASRGVVVVPDTTLAEALDGEPCAVALPGGGTGSERLFAEPLVRKALERARDAGLLVAAICAAPAVVLQPLGFLGGKRATGYPALAERIPGWVDEPVVVDGRLITSQGPGTAFEFALALVRALVSEEKAASVRAAALA